MNEIIVRNAVATDIKRIMMFDHASTSDYVWQYDLQHNENQETAIFRQIRLPRTISIRYPKKVDRLPDEWNMLSCFLVALMNNQLCGYLRLTDHMEPEASWITDLVVDSQFRRRGVGKSLLQSAQQWALDRKKTRIIIEVSSKNDAAIRLIQKFGYEFCGFNDNYFDSQDVALFFGRGIKI